MQTAFEKNQHQFIIKTLNKMGIEGLYLNISKTICGKSTANIILNILNSEKLKAFPQRSGGGKKKDDCSDHFYST